MSKWPIKSLQHHSCLISYEAHAATTTPSSSNCKFYVQNHVVSIFWQPICICSKCIPRQLADADSIEKCLNGVSVASGIRRTSLAPATQIFLMWDHSNTDLVDGRVTQSPLALNYKADASVATPFNPILGVDITANFTF